MMSGSRRSVFPVSVFPVTVAPTVLGLDWVVADAGAGESGERPSRPRGVPIAVLLLASSTDALVRPGRPESSDAVLPMLQRLVAESLAYEVTLDIDKCVTQLCAPMF